MSWISHWAVLPWLVVAAFCVTWFRDCLIEDTTWPPLICIIVAVVLAILWPAFTIVGIFAIFGGWIKGIVRAR